MYVKVFQTVANNADIDQTHVHSLYVLYIPRNAGVPFVDNRERHISVVVPVMTSIKVDESRLNPTDVKSGEYRRLNVVTQHFLFLAFG